MLHIRTKQPWGGLMVRLLTMILQILLRSGNLDGVSTRLGQVQACIKVLEELEQYRHKKTIDIAQSRPCERNSIIPQVERNDTPLASDSIRPYTRSHSSCYLHKRLRRKWALLDYVLDAVLKSIHDDKSPADNRRVRRRVN